MKKIIQFLRPAAIISSLPNTISNGQTMDATPLTANFNHVVNQVNANAAELSNTALLDTANVFTATQTGVAASAATHFPIASQIQNSVFLTLTSTLGTNTITARCAALTLTALANGQIFTFVPSQTNTGPVDLNPDGIGNTRILMMGTNIAIGNIIKDVPLAVRYQSPYFHALNAFGGLATFNNTGLKILDTNASHTLNIKPGSNLTADQTLTIVTGDASFTVTLTGDPTISSAATQANQEAGTSTDNFVTPAFQQFHPSAAKGFCKSDGAGSISSSYNADAMTDNGAGDLSFNWTTDFSSASYVAHMTIQGDTDTTAAGNIIGAILTTSLAAGVTRVHTRRLSDYALTDTAGTMVTVFGDQ